MCSDAQQRGSQCRKPQLYSRAASSMGRTRWPRCSWLSRQIRQMSPKVLAEEQLRLPYVTSHTVAGSWGSGWPSAGPPCHSRLPWPFPGSKSWHRGQLDERLSEASGSPGSRRAAAGDVHTAATSRSPFLGTAKRDTQPCPAASLRTQQWKSLLSDKPKMLPGDAVNQRGENLCLGREYSVRLRPFPSLSSPVPSSENTDRGLRPGSQASPGTWNSGYLS